MGQYQLWLHYREVDQDLQAQLETLERELAQLLEHAHLLEQSIQPPYDTLSSETSSAGDHELLQTDNQIIHALAGSVHGWFSPITTPLLPTPPSDMALLPEDMLTFFDQYDQTEPQLEIPRWLRNVINHPDGLIDLETIRTNRLVQRWVERWNRHSASQQSHGRTTYE